MPFARCMHPRLSGRRCNVIQRTATASMHVDSNRFHAFNCKTSYICSVFCRMDAQCLRRHTAGLENLGRPPPALSKRARLRSPSSPQAGTPSPSSLITATLKLKGASKQKNVPREATGSCPRRRAFSDRRQTAVAMCPSCLRGRTPEMDFAERCRKMHTAGSCSPVLAKIRARCTRCLSTLAHAP